MDVNNFFTERPPPASTRCSGPEHRRSSGTSPDTDNIGSGDPSACERSSGLKQEKNPMGSSWGSPLRFRCTLTSYAGHKSTSPKISPARAPLPFFSGTRGSNSRKSGINSGRSGHFHVGEHETINSTIWTAKKERGRVSGRPACVSGRAGLRYRFSGNRGFEILR